MRQVSIATIGTSLTNGLQAGPDSWQSYLTVALRGAGSVDPVVYNFGISGASSESYLASLAAPLKTRPDILLMEFTINDAYTPYAISLAECEANAINIIEQFRAVNADIVPCLMVMNPCVAGSGPALDRPNLVAYNDVYRDLAAGDPDLKLIDNWASWGTPDLTLIPDGIHPPRSAEKPRLIPNIVTALAPLLT